MRKHRLVPIVAGCVALVTVPVIAVAAPGSDNPAEPQATPPALSTPVAAIQSVPEVLQARIGLLRGGAARTASSDVSPGGINRDLERTVKTSVGPVTVVPGAEVVCVEIPDGDTGQAGTCAPIADVLDGGLVLSLRARLDDPATLVGVVPDGVSSVQLTGAPEVSTSVSVRNNVWVAEHSLARSAVLEDADASTANATIAVR